MTDNSTADVAGREVALRAVVSDPAWHPMYQTAIIAALPIIDALQARADRLKAENARLRGLVERALAICTESDEMPKSKEEALNRMAETHMMVMAFVADARAALEPRP